MRKYFIYLVVASLALPAFGAGRGRSKRPAPPKPTAQDPGLRSPAVLVADMKTGEILWSREADQPRSVASLSKLMAALVLLEHDLDLEATQTITKEDKRLVRRGAPTRLKTGCAYTHLDLLHAALMVSDNVALVALGRSMGWTPAEFGIRMTERARELGLAQTRFEDPTGLAAGNISTPREMFNILQAALDHPILRKICRTEVFTVAPAKGKARPIHYRHTDYRALHHPWPILGAKTGFTLAAQYCLAIAALHGERQVGMIFLGSYGELTRFGDYARTMRWLTRQAAAPALQSSTIPPKQATQNHSGQRGDSTGEEVTTGCLKELGLHPAELGSPILFRAERSRIAFSRGDDIMRAGLLLSRGEGTLCGRGRPRSGNWQDPDAL
jgi:D-alanyl-D-alanine endopeptidase (penicillin-binding protein 7)